MSPAVRRSALVLLVALLAIYGRGLGGAFVNDDRTYFVENDDLPTLGIAGVATVFLRPTNVWGEYLPIRDVAYLAQFAAFGRRPLGYHVVSLLLYAVTCALAFALVRRLTPERAPPDAPPGSTAASSALLVTALFVTHPTHVESVAYVSGQKDLLSAAFTLACLLAFARAFARRDGRAPWVALGAALYGLALLSKLTAVVLAVLVPVLWLLSNPASRPSPRRALFTWAAINVPAAGWFGWATITGTARWLSTSAVSEIPFVERIPRALKILGALSRNALWPHPLSFGYPFDGSGPPDGNLLAGLLVLAACGAAAWRFRKEPPVLFAVALFLLSLLPVLQLHGTLNNASIFDRYLFLPVLGLAIVAERLARWLFVERLGRPPAHPAACAALALAGALGSNAYVPAFASDVAVSRNSYEAFPGWNRPPFELAYALLEAGKAAEARALLATDRSLERPQWVRPYLEGWALLVEGRTAAAVPLLQWATGLAEAGGYCPFPHVRLGGALLLAGRLDEAEASLRRAVACPIYQPVEAYHARKLLDEVARRRAR